jgi:hypothetical protein
MFIRFDLGVPPTFDEGHFCSAGHGAELLELFREIRPPVIGE